jgi:hypothetical protein
MLPPPLPPFSSFPALVMLEALPGGVPNRSASRMPVELKHSRASHRLTPRDAPTSSLTLVTMTRMLRLAGHVLAQFFTNVILT